MLNKNNTSEEKRTYTVSEVAKILDIGKSSAYNLVKCNAFRTIRIGKAIRILIKLLENDSEKKEKLLIL